MSVLTTPAPVATADRNTQQALTPMSPKRLARITGALYLVLAVLGMLGPLTIESMVVPGDAAATADNIAASSTQWGISLAAWVIIVAVDVAISVLLYALLAPVSRTQSFLAAAFRVTYSVVMGALLVDLFSAHQLLRWPGQGDTAETQALLHLETFADGFLAALVFFGIHLVFLGWLFGRSGYLPRFFGPLLMVAGAAYVVDSLAKLTVDGYGGMIHNGLMVPAVLGEIGLTLWLLIKGVRTSQQ